MLNLETVIEFFQEIDSQINKKLDICIIGSNVFVFLNLKSSSPDLDLLIEGKNYNEFLTAYDKIKKKFPFSVDLLTNSQLENLKLPKNYMKRSKPYRRFRRKFKYIRLWLLSPYFIIISKINRMSTKDFQDLTLIMSHYKIYERTLKLFIKKCHIPNETKFKENYSIFLKNFREKLKYHWWE